MSITVNFKALIGAVVAAIATVMTANGSIDNYIAFAGEANAAAFCLVSGMMTILCAAGSFTVNR